MPWMRSSPDKPRNFKRETPYDHHRRLEREILKVLTAKGASHSYSALVSMFDPGKTGDVATVLNGLIAYGLITRGAKNVKITERGRAVLKELPKSGMEKKGMLPKGK